MVRFLLLLLLCLLGNSAHAAERLSFRNCTPEQTEHLSQLAEQTQTVVARAITDLEEGSAQPHLLSWFGVTNPARVQAVLSAVLERFTRPPALIFNCTTAGCRPGLMGYAGAHEFFLCPAFFTHLPTLGFDTQMGMLVHELTHLTADTADFAYGPARARHLAARTPTLALRNADSYQFFIESLWSPSLYGAQPFTLSNSCPYAYDGVCDEGLAGGYICPLFTDQADCQPLPANSCRAVLLASP